MRVPWDEYLDAVEEWALRLGQVAAGWSAAAPPPLALEPCGKLTATGLLRAQAALRTLTAVQQPGRPDPDRGVACPPSPTSSRCRS